VGLAVSRRSVAADGRLAALLFQWWWFLIGANKIAAASAGLAAGLGLAGAAAYIAVIYLNVIVLCVSLGCLLSYFAYLVSGRTRPIRFVVAFYVAYYLLLTYRIAAAQPYDVGFGPWRSFLVNRVGLPAVTGLPVLVGLVLPQTIMAFVFLWLAFRVGNAHTASGWSWSASASSPGPRASCSCRCRASMSMGPGQVASRLIGLTSASLGLLAYATPRWLRRMLGLTEQKAAPEAAEA